MRFFLVQLMPDELIKKWRGSQAGNNFCRNLIAGGIFDRVLSLIQINVTEDIRKQTADMPDVDQVIQCRKFSHHGLGRLLNGLLENVAVVQAAKKFDSIWFYNVTKHTFIAFLLLWLMRKKIYVVMADYVPPRNWYDVLARIVYFAITRARGILSLSARTGIEHPNLRVIPGIVPEKHIIVPQPDELIPRFLLSGNLSVPYGIDMAEKVFSGDPELPLTMTGFTNEENELRRRVENFSNIDYKQNLPLPEYFRLLHSYAWALSLRNPDFAMNSYNFPSKMLEYLACGKIVLSTMRYEELDGFRYFYSEFDVKKIRETAHKIMSLSIEEQNKIRTHNANELKRFFVSEWNKQIEEMENHTF